MSALRRAATAALALALLGASPFTTEEERVKEGNARLGRGDAAGALSRYDEAERDLGRRAEIDHDRGGAHLAAGRPAEAALAFRRAAEAAPPALASRALQNLGSALAATGDREGAVRALSDALARDPSNDDARWNLEVLLRGRSASRAPKPGEAEKEGAREEAAAPQPQGGRKPDREEQAREGERKGEAPARSEPLSRQEAEKLLDALRARERRAPPFGQERRSAGRADAAKPW